MSKTAILNSGSDGDMTNAQQAPEQTPSEPILPPQPSGYYEVDDSVRACEIPLSNAAFSDLDKTASPVTNEAFTAQAVLDKTHSFAYTNGCQITLDGIL